jgi:hypothetical protein
MGELGASVHPPAPGKVSEWSDPDLQVWSSPASC